MLIFKTVLALAIAPAHAATVTAGGAIDAVSALPTKGELVTIIPNQGYRTDDGSYTIPMPRYFVGGTWIVVKATSSLTAFCSYLGYPEAVLAVSELTGSSKTATISTGGTFTVKTETTAQQAYRTVICRRASALPVVAGLTVGSVYYDNARVAFAVDMPFIQDGNTFWMFRPSSRDMLCKYSGYDKAVSWHEVPTIGAVTLTSTGQLTSYDSRSFQNVIDRVYCAYDPALHSKRYSSLVPESGGVQIHEPRFSKLGNTVVRIDGSSASSADGICHLYGYARSTGATLGRLSSATQVVRINEYGRVSSVGSRSDYLQVIRCAQ